MRSQRVHQLLLQLVLVLLLLGLLGLSVALAQDEQVPRLDITGVDTSEFPVSRLTFIAASGESVRMSDISGLEVSEDGIPAADFALRDRPVGVEVIFIIDANASINDRDGAGAPTRREKVRDSVIRYAEQFMNDAQMDRVSIVIPDGEDAQLLVDRAVFSNAVINEINFYEPDPTGDTPLNEMMLLALNQAAGSHDEGRFQAVVLFTDGANLDQQLDISALVEEAQAINIPIFSVILGARADANEIENVTRLAQPTRGSYVHMPEVELTDPLYTTLQEHNVQYEIQYRSQLSESGRHIVTVGLPGIVDDYSIELEIAAPAAEIVVDNSQPIRRVVSSPDAPIESAEPTSQPIVTRITWPDGFARELAEATLLVDGATHSTATEPEPDDGGLLELEWDITALDDATYELQVQVTDELGLQGSSDALPFVIEVGGIAVPPPTDAESAQTPEPEVAAAPEEEAVTQNVGIVGLVVGFVAIVVAFIVIIFAVVVVVRRRQQSEAAAASQPAETVAPADHDATQVIVPAFVAQKSASAFLEPLENATEHAGSIPVTGDSVAIGRDAKLAQIVFRDKSVSRLHARIMQTGGVYRLYDEGSASGTYINFEQLSLTPQNLKDNDDIHIGRVHLRFHLAAEAEDEDSTQVMPAPQKPVAAQAPPVDEEVGTQPYIPHQPAVPGQEPSASAGGEDDDEDEISTQPYIPHSPKR